MNKLRLVTAITALLVATVYLSFHLHFPSLVAHSLSDEPSVPLTGALPEKIEKFRKPLNRSASVMIETIHQSEITIDEILKAIDHAKEEQAIALLEELNKTGVVSHDQVFELVVKHFPVTFDIEVFRKPFKEKVQLGQIRRAIHYANMYRERNEIDEKTARTIAKRILVQKEEEFYRAIKK